MKKIEFYSENILKCIDESVKKTKNASKKNYPYAVVIHPQIFQQIKLDSFTRLSKSGKLITVPIIQDASLLENIFLLAASEEDLKEMYINKKALSNVQQSLPIDNYMGL